jgi:hypothetical protein
MRTPPPMLDVPQQSRGFERPIKGGSRVSSVVVA